MKTYNSMIDNSSYQSMTKVIKLLVLFYTLFFFSFSYGISEDEILTKYKQKQRKFDNVMVLNCTPTPSFWYDGTRPEFYSTNNLRRKVGYAKYADGQCIQIVGRVTDRECVPIVNVLVRIWHADSNGWYRNKIDHHGYLNDSLLYNRGKNQIPTVNRANNNPKLDEMFPGSGSTLTDNLGYYRFYTIRPGSHNSKESPKIYFSLKNVKIPLFETVMFFPDSYIREELERITKSRLLQNRLIAVRMKEEETFFNQTCPIYRYDITMNINAKYRAY